MWARSTLRINVLATLAAILDTPLTKQGNAAAPCISEAHWDYFERIVMDSVNNFKVKTERRDLRTGGSVQLKNRNFGGYVSKVFLGYRYSNS